jgi:hypothetical protein
MVHSVDASANSDMGAFLFELTAHSIRAFLLAFFMSKKAYEDSLSNFPFWALGGGLFVHICAA